MIREPISFHVKKIVKTWLPYYAGIYDPESPEFGKYVKRPNSSKNQVGPQVVTSVSNVTKQLEFQISGDTNDGDQDHVKSLEA